MKQCNEQGHTSAHIYIISLKSCKMFCCFERICALVLHFVSDYVSFVFEVAVVVPCLVG